MINIRKLLGGICIHKLDDKITRVVDYAVGLFASCNADCARGIMWWNDVEICARCMDDATRIFAIYLTILRASRLQKNGNNLSSMLGLAQTSLVIFWRSKLNVDVGKTTYLGVI